MAGREQRGVEAAEADLFQGRPYVLTPRAPAELETPMVHDFTGWIDKIGAFRLVLDAGEHDRVVAYTSHLPQLASTAIAALLEGRAEPQTRVFGPALVDATRLALSSFDIWGDILITNQQSVQTALQSYIAKLTELSRVLDLDPSRMREHFERAAKFAAKVRDSS
jgi:prephenate dehydrogenase